MITIAEIVVQLVAQSPFISEALSEGLINVSALARRFQPELEKRLGKSVQLGAIVMAINRMPYGELAFVEKDLRRFFKKLTDISVRSNLVDFTFANSETILSRQTELLAAIGQNTKTFYSFSQGIAETTVLVNEAIEGEVERIFSRERLLDKERDLSSITLMLPEENRTLYGIYYYILKDLAWYGINLVELISTSNEFTLVVHREDVDRAFTVLLRLREAGR